MKAFFTLILALLFTAGFAGRNAKFDNLADRTWLNLCAYQGHPTSNGGSSEVPWTYDANSRKFVRIGGCTNVYNNGINSFDVGTETWKTEWPYDATSPTDRPPCGCNRGTCYDPHTRLVWTVGGQTGGCGGSYGLWKGDMAGHTWDQLLGRQGLQAHVAADTAHHRVILYYWDVGSFKHCKLYYPADDRVVAVPPMPGTSETESVYYPQQTWYAVEYSPAMNALMVVGYYREERGYTAEWFTWVMDLETLHWTDLKPAGLPAQHGRCVLSYDPMGRVMLLMVNGYGLFVYNQGGNAWNNITTPNDPAGGWSEMFEYDSEHNAHLFVSLGSNNRVWAFRYRNDPVSSNVNIPGAVSFPGLNCHPNPFASKVSVDMTGFGGAVEVGVYSPAGELVVRQKLSGPSRFLWDAAGFPAGVYLLKAAGRERVQVQKLLLQH